MNKISFTPFPVQTTDRLLLRKLTVKDKSVLFSLRTDKKVNQYIKRPVQQSESDTGTFINKISKGIRENKVIFWAICLKEAPSLIGTICLWNISEDGTVAELGYELSPNHQGMGLMNEAINTILIYGFDTLQLNMITAYTHKHNAASIKILLKHGFVFNPNIKDDDNINNVIFELYNKTINQETKKLQNDNSTS